MRYQWLAEYRCGCAEVQSRKKDLVGYCGKHGDEPKRITKLPIFRKEDKMEEGQIE